MLKRGISNWQRLPVNPMVDDVLRFLRADLVRREVVVESELAAGLPDITADRVPFEQILINIINNACDAMQDRAPGERVVHIRTSVDAGTVTIAIGDRGIGLPEKPERVFEPFYTTKAEGLGMGLAISRSIITAHGGRLWAEANPDRGATFRVSVPMAAEPQ
jgi:signal transduction histidine kinase